MWFVMDDKLHEKIGIPKGHYCYTVISHTDHIRVVKYCPFWYGSRPNGGCLVYGWDAALGDACKACGWLQPEEPIF